MTDAVQQPYVTIPDTFSEDMAGGAPVLEFRPERRHDKPASDWR